MAESVVVIAGTALYTMNSPQLCECGETHLKQALIGLPREIREIWP
jgi:hypothetical protein